MVALEGSVTFALLGASIPGGVSSLGGDLLSADCNLLDWGLGSGLGEGVLSRGSGIWLVGGSVRGNAEDRWGVAVAALVAGGDW